MYNHAPKNDPKCFICPAIEGLGNEHTLIKQTDVVYKDDLVTAFINSFFIGKNSGHIIIVPNKHIENIYDLPVEYGHKIFEVSQKIAIAMKQSYECDGVTIRQNNEPAADQHALHYHLHIFPRYENDGYNKDMTDKRLASPEERLEYAIKIKSKLQT